MELELRKYQQDALNQHTVVLLGSRAATTGILKQVLVCFINLVSVNHFSIVKNMQLLA